MTKKFEYDITFNFIQLKQLTLNINIEILLNSQKNKNKPVIKYYILLDCSLKIREKERGIQNKFNEI